MISVRLHGDLADLAGEGLVEVPATEPRSVKDLVESVGVPHTEIGRVRVDARDADLAHRIEDGEVVDVHPVASGGASPLAPERPEPVRFVADVHLGRLAELLRLVGFDTEYATDLDDERLARRAVEDGRILLSRDRGLLKRATIVHGYLVRSTAPEEQLAGVVRRFGLADELRPFTRCVRCNGALEEVAKAAIIDRLEPGTRRDHDEFVRCGDCGQIYWSGSHRDRLREIVRIARSSGR